MQIYKNRKSLNAMVFAAICFFLIPADINAGSIQLLTSEYLVSCTWGPDTGSWGSSNDVGMKIKFNSNSLFESETMYGQDGCSSDGTYSIKSGKLNLSMESSKAESFCGVMTIKNGVLRVDTASLKYREYIIFNRSDVKGLYFDEDLKIWNYNSIVKEGDHVSIKNLKAVAMGIKKAITTAVLKVRETPDTKGGEIHFSSDDYETGEEITHKAIPNNTGVTVLARTKDKNTVGKWNNYWYYIEFNGNTRGWVFGEFIKIL